MKKTVDEIFEFLYVNNMNLNKKAIIMLIKAYECDTDQLYKLNRTSKEYIADNLFSDKEAKKFFRGRKGRYFVDTAFKRVYNDNRR